MANVIRSRIRTTLLLVGVLASLPAGRSWAQCLGDCDGSGGVGAGELTKIIAIINYCPCTLPSVGGLASGCAALPGGTDKQCTNADRSGNGCITAGELTGVIADLLNYPSTGCPPGPTATNTPLTPPTSTPTTPAPPNSATPTNTSVPTATNTVVGPTNTSVPTTTNTALPTPTNTSLPTATNTALPTPTNSSSPTATKTNTPPTPPTSTPTNTQAIGGTATATPTATTQITVGPHCGDGTPGPGEECDDGGTCVGGSNAGTHCTAESQCIGQGVCDSGFNIEAACDTDADCLQGHCIRCRPFGGDGCAANCTLETNVPVTLIKGGTTSKPGTSFALIHTNKNLPKSLILPLSGSQTIIVGKVRNGQITAVIKAASVNFGSIDVLAGSACACVRGAAAMTCGGYISEKDGTGATDCTPGFIAGTCSATTTTTCLVDGDCPSTEHCVVHACDGKKPCAYVHGPGNSATGLIGCTGLNGTNLTQTQNAGGNPAPPTYGTPPPGASPGVITIGNACGCTTDADCGTGHTCNLGTGKCACNSQAECVGGEICSINAASNPGAGTPTPTPGSCLGICQQNSACPLTQTCTAGGPGSAVFVNSTAIGQFVGKCVVTPTPGHTDCAGTDHGTDCKWCTDDDPARSRGVPQTLPAVTGFGEGLITNDYFPDSKTVNNVGPYVVTGGPISCSQITAPTPSMSGIGLAGAFTALNQPTIGDSVVNNLQFIK